VSGPTAAQTNLSNEQASFYQEATAQSQQTYAEDQKLQQQFSSIYSPILAKGPNQQGFSSQEEQDLNAQAVEGTAENYQGAAKAVNEKLAAEGGGTNPLESGPQAQLQEEVASSAAGTESQEENQINEQNYAQGYNEFEGATGALESEEGNLNPAGYENAATGAGSAASTTANEIAQENDSWENAALGAVGAIGGGLAGNTSLFASKTPCWIAAELWGGWDEPRVMKVRLWIHCYLVYTRTGKVLFPLYMRYGEKTAQVIRRWPWLKCIFRPVFNLALRKAERCR